MTIKQTVDAGALAWQQAGADDDRLFVFWQAFGGKYRCPNGAKSGEFWDIYDAWFAGWERARAEFDPTPTTLRRYAGTGIFRVWNGL